MPAASRFVLVTPSGHGNLGDAAIQDTVIAQLRARFPSAAIVVASLNPEDTERRHGVQAFPLVPYSRPWFALHRGGPAGAERDSWPARVARALPPLGWAARLRAQVRHAHAAFNLLRGTTALIVSGGGQLDEFWGGPWGQPWTLYKWATLARLRGARVLVLSTGLGTLQTRLARSLARRAMTLAHYRSYRDPGSRALMRAAGLEADDPVVPDLAYGLPLPEMTTPPGTSGTLTVGVSPIVYCDPRNWPRQDAAVFEAYVRRLEGVIAWLRQAGHRVVLLSSNRSDGRLAQEIFDRVRDVSAPGPVELAETGEVKSFLCVAGRMDVLVASRLHGILLAHLMGTPVIALSHDRKVDEHMREMGRDDSRLEIERFEPAQFERAFRDTTASASRVRAAITERVAALRRQVLDQFEATLRV